MKTILFISLLFLMSINAHAQSSTTKDSSETKNHIIQDYRIEQLNDTYESTYSLSGYRIQIYSGSKRQPAKQARLKFSQKYSNIPAHESYQQPYFKIRVGDFKTKLEAVKFQKELIQFFPNCFIVQGVIDFK